MSGIFKGNMRTRTEKIKLTDKKKLRYATNQSNQRVKLCGRKSDNLRKFDKLESTDVIQISNQELPYIKKPYFRKHARNIC